MVKVQLEMAYDGICSTSRKHVQLVTLSWLKNKMWIG